MFPKDWIGNMPKCSGWKDFLNFPLQDFHKEDSNTRFDKEDSNTKKLSPDIVGKGASEAL